MLVAKCHLVGVTPYSQNKYIETAKKKNESYQEYEERVWAERTHINEESDIITPARQFKNCISDATQYACIKIKGEGQSRYTKNFLAGIAVANDFVLLVKRKDLKSEGYYTFLSKGKPLVWKRFPLVMKWEGIVEYYVFDKKITTEIFEEVLELGGKLVGIGRNRPQNGGDYGRFLVNDIKWEEMEEFESISDSSSCSTMVAGQLPALAIFHMNFDLAFHRNDSFYTMPLESQSLFDDTF